MASPASHLKGTTPGAAGPARRIIRSFRFAFAGLCYLVVTQPNAWVHLVLAGLALGLSVVLRLSAAEIGLVVLTIGLVLAAEAVNTAVEAVCDLVSPGYHPLVRRAKDVAAGGVLIAALAAIGVALTLFAPRLLALAH